jgi:hypothetical protein
MKSALGNNMTQQILFQYQERLGLGSVRFALIQPCADIAAPSVKPERYFDIFGNLKDWGSSNQRTLPMCRILDHLHEQLCTWFEQEWAAPFPVFSIKRGVFTDAPYATIFRKFSDWISHPIQQPSESLGQIGIDNLAIIEEVQVMEALTLA